jgi:diaminopimelate epimerase
MILIEPSDTVDFKWRFFNADGSLPDMCGNGARCAARFAFMHGIADRQMAFETLAGTIEATVGDDGVKIRMTDPEGSEYRILWTWPEDRRGGQCQHRCAPRGDGWWMTSRRSMWLKRAPDPQSPDFAPDGTNANFVADGRGQIFIRTYERGVEDETLACGTGNVAAALILAHRTGIKSPVTLTTRSGGKLTVHFNTDGGSLHGCVSGRRCAGDLSRRPVGGSMAVLKTDHAVFISVGSNLGDKLDNCLKGIAALTESGKSVLLGDFPVFPNLAGGLHPPGLVRQCGRKNRTSMEPLDLLDELAGHPAAHGAKSRCGPVRSAGAGSGYPALRRPGNPDAEAGNPPSAHAQKGLCLAAHL